MALRDCSVPPVTALRGCRIVLVVVVVVVVVVTVDFFSTTPSNFSFDLSFVVRLLTGFSFWFWLDGPAISPTAVCFLFVGAVHLWGGVSWCGLMGIIILYEGKSGNYRIENMFFYKPWSILPGFLGLRGIGSRLVSDSSLKSMSSLMLGADVRLIRVVRE